MTFGASDLGVSGNALPEAFRLAFAARGLSRYTDFLDATVKKQTQWTTTATTTTTKGTGSYVGISAQAVRSSS